MSSKYTIRGTNRIHRLMHSNTVLVPGAACDSGKPSAEARRFLDEKTVAHVPEE